MWWTDWVKTLFSGFAGSVVGLIGAVVAIYVGRWLERREADDKRMRKEAAEIVATLSMLTNKEVIEGVKVAQVVRRLRVFHLEAFPRFPHFSTMCRLYAHWFLDAAMAKDTKKFDALESAFTVNVALWYSKRLSDKSFQEEGWELRWDQYKSENL